MALEDQTPVTRVYDVKAMGCACDGVFANGVWTGTDDRAILQRILDVVSAAGGGDVYFPGICMVSRAGASPYSLSLTGAKNIRLFADKGRGGIVQTTGLPDASVAGIRWNLCTNCTMDGMYVSGNWGNAVTEVLPSSNNAVLPQAIINVKDTSRFPAAASFSLVTPTGVQVIDYTGKTATSFTGCTGGVGAINVGQKCGYVDAHTGINQTSQGDPKNYGSMFRGGADNTVKGCIFENTYGDAIWIGGSTDLTNVPPVNMRVLDTDINISARNGITLIGGNGIIIDNCRITNVFAGAIDSEPVGGPVRNVKISKCTLGAWFNPGAGGGGQIPLTIVGGESNTASQTVYCRDYRVTDCVVDCCIYISTSFDVEIRGCRVINSFYVDGFQGAAPISVIECNDAIKIVDNYIYDRTPGAGGSNHVGAIQVRMATQGGDGRDQPADVLIRGNTIFARAGTHGIAVEGAGGGSIGNTFSNQIAGVASAITDGTLTHAGSAWTVNAFRGWQVRVGTANAAISSNTADELTLALGSAEFAALAWTDPLGERCPTPAPGAYVIWKPTSLVEIAGNKIDCSDDGWGQGGFGMFVSAVAGSNSAGGMRLWVHHNTLKNCDEDGINLEIGGIKWEQCLVHDNTGFDNQDVATMTSLIRFSGAVDPVYDQLVLRNNAPHPSVANAVSGLDVGFWLVNGGMVPVWAGYGSPETVITAPIGAMYQRVDGSASSVLYMKESGTGNTGWVPYASPSSALITNFFNIAPIGDGASTLWNDGPPFTIVGTASQPGVTDGDFFARVRKVKYVSAAGAGSVTSLRNGGGLNYIRGSDIGGGYRVTWRFSVGDAVAVVATANMFVGLRSSIAAPTDVAPSTLTDILGVGVDSGDTTLQLYGAGPVAQARVDLGASFPANTRDVDVYELDLICAGGGASVAWKVTRLNTGDVAAGVLVGAAIPNAGSAMTTVAYRSNGGTAAAVGLNFHQLHTEVPI